MLKSDWYRYRLIIEAEISVSYQKLKYSPNCSISMHYNWIWWRRPAEGPNCRIRIQHSIVTLSKLSPTLTAEASGNFNDCWLLVNLCYTLLIYWDFKTQLSPKLTENKRKYPVNVCCAGKAASLRSGVKEKWSDWSGMTKMITGTEITTD